MKVSKQATKQVKTETIVKSEENITTIPSNAIYEYIRKRHGGKTFKTGVILGVNEEGTIKIGYSKCNINEDKFNEKAGVQIAYKRAIAPMLPIIPRGLRQMTRRFAGRCIRYYKDACKVELPLFAE